MENGKEITLINKIHDSAINISIPNYIYTNYVLTGDKTEIDYWLENEISAKARYDIKKQLCPSLGRCLCNLYQEVIVEPIDQKFMQQKNEEIQKLLHQKFS